MRRQIPVKMIASTQTNHPLAASSKNGTRVLAPVETATAKLKAAGLRITQPRLAILGALSRRAQPTSIEQLHEDVGAENCDLVTVYRCMAAFEEMYRRGFQAATSTPSWPRRGSPKEPSTIISRTRRRSGTRWWTRW